MHCAFLKAALRDCTDSPKGQHLSYMIMGVIMYPDVSKHENMSVNSLIKVYLSDKLYGTW